MPRIRLSVITKYAPIPVEPPGGGQLLLPRPQLRCLVTLPGHTLPQDGIVDVGSPFSWFPESIWQRLRPGVDYEWLPYPAGYQPPSGKSVGWTFRFRMARLLGPLELTDMTVAVPRHDVILQFTEGDPPSSQTLATVTLGLWGGVLEGSKLHITTDPVTSLVAGSLEF